MNVIIINGPNLNLTGQRETDIYGTQTPEAFLAKLRATHPELSISYYQSNIEGELVTLIQQHRRGNGGIILNAGAYSHTSIAIADAVKACEVPVVEVHMSQVYSREPYRHVSFLSPVCKGVITGFGWSGYEMALMFLSGKM